MRTLWPIDLAVGAVFAAGVLVCETAHSAGALSTEAREPKEAHWNRGAPVAAWAVRPRLRLTQLQTNSAVAGQVKVTPQIQAAPTLRVPPAAQPQPQAGSLESRIFMLLWKLQKQKQDEVEQKDPKKKP